MVTRCKRDKAVSPRLERMAGRCVCQMEMRYGGHVMRGSIMMTDHMFACISGGGGAEPALSVMDQ